MRFLKVPRKDGERTRQKLLAAGLLDNGYSISSEGGFVYLPLVHGGEGRLPAGVRFESVEREGEKRELPPKKLADALSGLLSAEDLGALVASFDIIGDIAIVEIPEQLEPKEKAIGEALLRVHKNLKTVLKKLGPMEGEFRVRRLGFVCGEDRTETIYRENGVPMKLDVAKVYFSVRLASERKRIAELAGPGERVLVLFAGVGPFALAIAKKRPHAHIVAVEINPDAVRYMKGNIALSRFGNIEALLGDARMVVPSFPAGSFDRVIMPLPKSAEDFLDLAFSAVKDGGTVHFYTLAGASDPFGDAMKRAKLKAEKSGVSITAKSWHIVRPYSPLIVQVVLDISVRRK
jgi:tRNA (guanine37-N1)-methyltransferase